ncbi:VanZ family protein [Microbacterium sp.]|uniref:VanZ family protein n=1 Tax=Microbacterium sp. TaxID=51671 RepID=UPI003F6EDDBD
MTTSAQPESPAASVAPPLAVASTARPRRRSIAVAIVSEPGLWLLLYVVGLAFVAFWPVPIDRDADAILASMTQAVPWLTYERIEFLANVVLFMPFGLLLVATLRRRGTLALLIAVGVSIVMEAGQAAFLLERTPSILDIVANTTGAAIGIVLALDLLRPAKPRS